jgi:hypothetical protein
MEITSKATTLSQHGEDKRYQKAIAKHDYIKQIPLPCVMMIVGSSGSRKTSFMLTLLRDLQDSARYFDIILLYSGSMDTNEQFEVFGTKKTEVKVLNDFNESEFQKFISKIEEQNMKRKEERKKLINVGVIFDDPVSIPGLKMGTAQRPSAIDRLCTTCRHFNISLFYLIQRYRLMNMVMRGTNLSHLILLGIKSKELDQIAEEHSYELVDNDEFKEIYNDIRNDGDNNFMVVNYKVPKIKRMQQNFIPYIDIIKSKKLLEIDSDSDDK